MNLNNLYLALKEQLPLKRMFRNFFITGNSWGMFSNYSHYRRGSGEPKVSYSLKSAHKAKERMTKKHNTYFSVYKCVYCDGYHIGKNQK